MTEFKVPAVALLKDRQVLCIPMLRCVADVCEACFASFYCFLI